MNLYRTLRSLRDRERGIKPDPAWVRTARATLLMQVRNTMPTAAIAARHQVSFFASLYRRIVTALRGPVIASISITGVVLGGSVVSVSAAERSIPGDTLYSIKLVTEQARLAFAGTKTDKVKLKAEFTLRRVEELKAIVTTDVSEKEVRTALAADVLKRDLDTLKQQMDDVQQSPNKDSAEAAQSVDQSTADVVKGLAETKDALSPEVQAKVTDAQAQAADIGIKALEVMVATQEQGDGAVSSQDIGASLAAHMEVASQANAAVKVLAVAGAASSPAAALMSPSSTIPVVGSAGATSTTALQLVKDAETSIATAQQLAGEQKLGEAVGYLKDATQKSFTAQKQVTQDALALTNAATGSSTSTVSLPGTAASSTASSSASSTSAAASSTKP